MDKKKAGIIIIILVLLGIAGYFIYKKFFSAASSVATPSPDPVDEAAYLQMKTDLYSFIEDADKVWSWLVIDVDKRLKGKLPVGYDLPTKKTSCLYSAIAQEVMIAVTGGPGYDSRSASERHELKAGYTYQQFSDHFWNSWVAFKNSEMYTNL